MTVARYIICTALALGSGCAGCGPLDGLDDNARNENGGVLVIDEVDMPLDARGGVDRADAGEVADLGGADLDLDLDRTEDLGRRDAATPTTDQGAADVAADVVPGAVCGDGILEGAELCDDGATTDCTGTHDGGDGVCVPSGTCSTTFVFDGTACVPAQISQHVHIYVANDCSMMVDPPELNVPRGQTVRFSWHNHSQFYAVDVWQSYIGGFTDLAPSMTWNEQFEWCFNVNPYVGYSDISSAPGCPEHRFLITCNGR